MPDAVYTRFLVCIFLATMSNKRCQQHLFNIFKTVALSSMTFDKTLTTLTRGSFLESLGSFWSVKPFFIRKYIYKRELYLPETSCTKGTSVHIKNI